MCKKSANKQRRATAHVGRRSASSCRSKSCRDEERACTSSQLSELHHGGLGQPPAGGCAYVACLPRTCRQKLVTAPSPLVLGSKQHCFVLLGGCAPAEVLAHAAQLDLPATVESRGDDNSGPGGNVRCGAFSGSSSLAGQQHLLEGRPGRRASHAIWQTSHATQGCKARLRIPATSAGRPPPPHPYAHLNDSRCSRYVCSAKASAWRKAMGSAPENVQPETDGRQGVPQSGAMA